MSLTRRFRRLGVACAAIAVACAAIGSADAAEKRFEWTTKSKEAQDAARECIRAIESFNFGPQNLEVAKKAVAADPDFAFGHYLVATFSPTPEAAKPEADKATELAKNASEGERRYMEAVFLIRANQADKALPILKELQVKYPDERLVQMMLGQALFNSGDLDNSKAAFEKAIKLDGSTPRAYSFIGNIYLMRNDYKTARKYFDQSMAKKAPGTAPFGPYTGIAYSYVYEGNYPKAIEVMETFRDDYIKTGGPQGFPEVFLWNSIARLQLESGHPDLAIELYKKGYASVESSKVDALDATQRQIWLGRLHHGTGRSLAKLGKHDDAWKEADTIKTMIETGGEPGKQFWPSYHYIAGYLKLEAGDFNAAIDHLKQTDLNDPFHALLLARAYDKVGNTAEAQKLYKQIVDSRVNNLERAISFPEARKKLKA